MGGYFDVVIETFSIGLRAPGYIYYRREPDKIVQLSREISMVQRFWVFLVLGALVLVGCNKKPTGLERPQLPEFWSEHIIGSSWTTDGMWPALRIEKDRILESGGGPFLVECKVFKVKETSEKRDSLVALLKDEYIKVPYGRVDPLRAISEGKGKFFRIEMESDPTVLYGKTGRELFTGGVIKVWANHSLLFFYNKKITLAPGVTSPGYWCFGRNQHGFPDPRGEGPEIQVPESWLQTVCKKGWWSNVEMGTAEQPDLWFEKNRILEAGYNILRSWDILEVKEVSEDRDSVAAYIEDWVFTGPVMGADIAETILYGKGRFFEVKVDMDFKILYPVNPTEYQRAGGFFSRQSSGMFRIWVWTFQKHGRTDGWMLFYKGIERVILG